MQISIHYMMFVINILKQRFAEPRRNAARRDGGKPEAKPQGGTEGGREKAARPDRGSALSSVGNSRPEREEFSARMTFPRETSGKAEEPGNRIARVCCPAAGRSGSARTAHTPTSPPRRLIFELPCRRAGNISPSKQNAKGVIPPCLHALWNAT